MPFISSVRGSHGAQSRLRGFIPRRANSTGGTITTSGAYRIHTFTTVGNSTLGLIGTGTVEYLIIAGGGGGASDGDVGGGGGAGGLLSGSVSLAEGNYTITVGDGGIAGSTTAWGGSDFSGTGAGTNGAQGNNSVFNGLTAIGGGYGGTRESAGGNGGSGGGGGDNSKPGGSGTSGQGNNGGAGPGMNSQSGQDSGGGGGAGSAASFNNPGSGLANSITGTSVTYAAGGRGIQLNTSQTAANNTGNGGPGVRKGGSGVVIVRYTV
jgi:hypothetical protein